jgi:hypothetical protein
LVIIPGQVRPLPNAEQHNSLTPAWWLGEVWPKFTKKRVTQADGSVKFVGRPRMNLFKARHISDKACIHQSVLDRQRRVPEYRPANLPPRLPVEPDPHSDPYPIHLEPQQSHVVGVHAAAKWNDTSLEFREGEAYAFTAAGRWFDASIEADATGWLKPRKLVKPFEPFRRVPHANWFALIGTIGKDDGTAFVVCEQRPYVVKTPGILHCYANDLPVFYGNNSGFLAVTITRLT